MINRARSNLILTAIALGLAATAWGIPDASWPGYSPLFWRFLHGSVPLVAVGALVVECLARYFRIGRYGAGAAVAVAICVLTGNIWPLIVAGWIAAASHFLGRGILALIRVDAQTLPVLAPLLVGAGIYGTAVGLLAHFPVNYPGTYGFGLALPLILSWRHVPRLFRRLGALMASPSRNPWLDLAIVAVTLVFVCVGLMPEMGYDALAMHLFVPGYLAANHKWSFDVTKYVWAVMPMMGDWLYSLAYMLGGETAARLLNEGFIFALVWLVREFVFWAGGDSEGARWGVLLLLTTPLAYVEGSSLFIELVWSSFILAGALCAFRAVDSDRKSNLPAAGLLLGAAFAAKAITFVVAPILVLALVFIYRRQFKAGLILPLCLACVAAFVLGCIPYLTAWKLTGNPVFPFFNGLFHSRLWPDVNFAVPISFEKGMTWEILDKVFFHSGGFLHSRLGESGFQWQLLLVPALLVLAFPGRRRALLLVAVAGLCLLLTFHFAAYLRYILPSFAWVAAALGVALSVIRGEAARLRVPFYFAACAAAGLNLICGNSGTRYTNLSLQAMSSAGGRDAYLRRFQPIREAVQLVNRLNKWRTPVAFFGFPYAAGLTSDALYSNWYNFRFEDAAKAAQTPEALAEVLLGRQVQFVISDEDRRNVIGHGVIEGATREIARFRSVTVREVRDEYRFQVELLKNTDLTSPGGWRISKGASMAPEGGVAVTASSPAFQRVRISPGDIYRYSITARCLNQVADGRLQVNWADKKGKVVSTNIRVFRCSGFDKIYSMKVHAPHGAAFAMVYASGHTRVPILVTKVSFKR